jgi:hypothetical protein
MKLSDSPDKDAFGRLRMSEPVTIFDSKQLHDNAPLFWDDSETSGSGTTSSHSTATASTTIGVSANTAGKRVRRTFQRMNYVPGMSQLIIMTAQMASQGALDGIIGRVGYFDDNDGVFFSMEDGVAYAVVRSSTSGSPVETKVRQSEWNIDPFDGSGPSGITLDPTKVNILMFDMEWLGSGRVRFGFNVDGINYIVHEQRHSNVLANVYMSTPNLPLTYEIENDGTGAATTMQHICSTVISEGGYDPLGVIREVDTGTTEITATNANTIYALLGFRLNSAALDTAIDFMKVEVLLTSAGTFHWELLFNPTITGSPSWSQLANSALDTFTGSSSITLTNGTSLGGGYGASTGSGGSAAGAIGSAIDNSIKLGAAIDGTQDIVVLGVSALGAGETFLGSVQTKELN